MAVVGPFFPFPLLGHVSLREPVLCVTILACNSLVRRFPEGLIKSGDGPGAQAANPM